MLVRNDIFKRPVQRSTQPARPLPPKNQKKEKILCWSDCVFTTTGFGTVSQHILEALHKTGGYDIDQLAINYFGDFFDKEKYPYGISPAKLKDPNDPYGNVMLIEALKEHEYDYLLIINDLYVTQAASKHISPLRRAKMDVGRKPYRVIYYYPVDCQVIPQVSGMITAADRAVAYTHFAACETQKTLGVDCKKPTDIIYHGTDVKAFFPLAEQEKQTLRKKMFPSEHVNADTFIIANVNRNSPRKALATTIRAFYEFRKRVPNSILYLHALAKDSGAGSFPVDLNIAIQQLGLQIGKDIFFPQGYSTSHGYPIEVMNKVYNVADIYISTHLGEGWGLTETEAMAAGVPVIVPNNTSTPEIVGEDGERGYVYPCKEIVYADNSGYRPAGRLDDIVGKLYEAYTDWRAGKRGEANKRSKLIISAREFTEKYSWDNVTKRWVELFADLRSQTPEWQKVLSAVKGEEL